MDKESFVWKHVHLCSYAIEVCRKHFVLSAVACSSVGAYFQCDITERVTSSPLPCNWLLHCSADLFSLSQLSVLCIQPALRPFPPCLPSYGLVFLPLFYSSIQYQTLSSSPKCTPRSHFYADGVRIQEEIRPKCRLWS